MHIQQHLTNQHENIHGISCIIIIQSSQQQTVKAV